MGSRTKALIIGAAAGAALGVAAAWLLMRSIEEEALAIEEAGEEAVAPRNIGAGQVMRLGVSILNVLHQIVDLGREE
jgi:hypothetical protein